jgi:iron complex outermembrane receptor protein
MNYETGFLKTFFNQKLSGEITFFMIKGDNLIVNVPLQGLLNSGEISNSGIEMAINAEPMEKLSIMATYSYINMKNPVFATPEHHLYFNANYRFNKFQLSASIQQISNLDNDPSPLVNSENYTLINAKAMYRLTQNIKFFISGENLLNQNYQVNNYYSMPGTTFFSGINLTL